MERYPGRLGGDRYPADLETTLSSCVENQGAREKSRMERHLRRKGSVLLLRKPNNHQLYSTNETLISHMVSNSGSIIPKPFYVQTYIHRRTDTIMLVSISPEAVQKRVPQVFDHVRTETCPIRTAQKTPCKCRSKDEAHIHFRP